MVGFGVRRSGRDGGKQRGGEGRVGFGMRELGGRTRQVGKDISITSLTTIKDPVQYHLHTSFCSDCQVPW